jgi:hypothetical protein
MHTEPSLTVGLMPRRLATHFLTLSTFAFSSADCRAKRASNSRYLKSAASLRANGCVIFWIQDTRSIGTAAGSPLL